tara:strand:- start:1009 stop:1542 length:534 start_codon:yes stop_codon:yes gene_type:complete
MKEILKKITDQSRFQVQTFHGALLLEGRILSPSEAESAGLLQYLIASQMMSEVDIGRMKNLKKKAEEVEKNNGDLHDLISEAKNLGFRPEAFAKLAEQQDRVICQCIKSASSDNGNSWEKLRIVNAEEQQDADKGLLWVGNFSQEDRKKIIDRAMEGHKEASEKLAGFFSHQQQGSF